MPPKPLSPWSRRPATLLARLIDAPDLVRQIRALPSPRFAALVRRVGVEDAGELVALATTDQLVAAFDEDLFVNKAPGERERFDPGRFVVWLEVLLEAGDIAAARRVAELSEDFVIGALSSIVLVLDHGRLAQAMSEGGPAAVYADKALESALCEELDGYLLVARRHEGWDAALALILALDRDHRPLLERILDRCAQMASAYTEELDRLATELNDAESLAEDVEAEREERRSRQGYVEPRAARSFLTLARQPLATRPAETPRDPITAAYFRELRPGDATLPIPPAATPQPPGLLSAVGEATAAQAVLPPPPEDESVSPEPSLTILAALQRLSDDDPRCFGERLQELTYLANVVVAGVGAGAEVDGRRFRPAEAAEAVLVTVALGAELEADTRRQGRSRPGTVATAAELAEVLRVCTADRLFRYASSHLASRNPTAPSAALLRSPDELVAALAARHRRAE